MDIKELYKLYQQHPCITTDSRNWMHMGTVPLCIAPVRSIHALTDKTKLLLPAEFLIVSNSVQLKLGLYTRSHTLRN